MASLVISEVEGVKVVTFQTLSILDAVDVEAIGQQLCELVDAQARRKILLDFHKVRQLSSQMLGVIVKLDKKSKAINGKVVLSGLRPEISKVFEVTRLNKILHIVADEREAMGCFAGLRGG